MYVLRTKRMSVNYSQMEWLKEQGFGGIMVWSIDMDDFSGRCGGGKYPLLKSLNQELSGYKVALEYEGPYETHGPRGAYTTKDRNLLLEKRLAFEMKRNFTTIFVFLDNFQQMK